MNRVFLSLLLLTACAAEAASIPEGEQPNQTNVSTQVPVPSGVARASAQEALPEPPAKDASPDSPPPPPDASEPKPDAAPANPGTDPTMPACESTPSREQLCSQVAVLYHWAVLPECKGTPYTTNPHSQRPRDVKFSCDPVDVGGGYTLLCCL